MTQAEALVEHPELMGAYRELVAQRQAIAQKYADVTSRGRALALVRSDIQRRLDEGRIPPLPRTQVKPNPGSEHERQLALRLRLPQATSSTRLNSNQKSGL